MRHLKIACCVAVGSLLHSGTANASDIDTTAVITLPSQATVLKKAPAASPTVPGATPGNVPAVKPITVSDQSSQPGPGTSTSVLSGGEVVLQAPPPPTKPVGPLSGLGNYLLDNGIQVGVLIDDFSLDQIHTGLVPHAWMSSGDIKYHLGLDLDKILDIPNTKINFDETEYILTHNDFDFVTKSNSFFFPGAGGDQPTMLSRLSIENFSMDHHLDVEVGRMNPIFNFMMPTFCGLCFNGTQARNAIFPGPDAQVWGGRAAYSLNPHETLQGGLYESDLYDFQNTNGWSFSTKHATGYVAVANYINETTFLDDTNPLKLEVGMFHNSAQYTDPLANSDGTSHILNPGGTELVHRGGKTGAYAQARKAVWSEGGALGNPFAENLAVYGTLFVTPGPGVSYPLEAMTGVELSNFIPNQPFWMFGVGLHYAMVGKQQALYEQQMRVVLGGADVSTPRNMLSPGVSLRFPVTDNAIAQVFGEYFINQDASYIPAAQRPQDGWFVGLRFTIDLGKALGLNAGGLFF
ncbi:MAG: carbohydrate porin [Azospirillaceae bacterium]|nr:carbohydrate porin [Azospirillaceae bacterium]